MLPSRGRRIGLPPSWTWGAWAPFPRASFVASGVKDRTGVRLAQRVRRKPGVGRARRSFYTPTMDRTDQPLGDQDRDLIESAPFVGRATTQLERSVGPSCLLSLVIVFLLAIVLRRFMSVSITGLGCMTVVVWFAIMLLLVRWRPEVVDDPE